MVEAYTSGKYSSADLSAKHNIENKVIRTWVNNWYNGIEIKDLLKTTQSIEYRQEN
ncbi:MAG: hypothetical protein GX892_01745 [Thermoanaerobacteraceae bacterium]|nr:hypothetical protein [Thermoanaerobacteraceae bacterium]